MANVLITYADDSFRCSAERIKIQARKTRFFDKIVIYTPKDMPAYIKGSPLACFKKGGGYWIWKPYILSDALSRVKDGDVVYYLDAGCRINPKFNDWDNYDSYLDKGYSSIFFEYRGDYDYNWSYFGVNSVALRHWIKPLTQDFFVQYSQTDDFLYHPKIMGGFIIVKKCLDKDIVDEWLRITLLHPELVIDPYGMDLTRLPQHFNCHRHDMTVLTPLVRYYAVTQHALVLPETCESQCDTASVVAERYKIGKLSPWDTLKFKLHYMFKE